ncbi:Aldehyde/histidinol dehydrogenase [Naematelia encephala]|uniref:Aldehyde dehydrogenase n=1 Tax=Naematelia encephala TaxID=71784 RepID=A0A1Y2B0B7_9TREE|nr:Aldehyde/histidinol dehydrogenase [Naematelia encephala]
MDLPSHIPTPVSTIPEIYERLQSRFADRSTYSLDYRRYNLKQLAYLINDNKDKIFEAVKRDLGSGDFQIQMSDLWPILHEIELAVKRLPGWMKDEGRLWDAIFTFQTMRPRIHKQPKGVALIIGPWNYPWQCILIPLIGAIAAGCPAVIKPSELAPSSSALLAQLVPQYLDPEAYAVVLGQVEQTTELLQRKWGHILFTGSGRVGKIIADAAAKTLTPTTLELGGKSPVIVSSCANLKITAKRLLSIKQLNTGQICVSPDYILVCKDVADDFIRTCTETLDTFFPHAPHPQSYLTSDMTASLHTSAALERQIAFLNKAEEEGKLVHRGELDQERRRLGISIVRLNANAEGEVGGIVEEEIFGPVVPVIPVDDVDAAIRYINARPNPLALYVCSGKRSVFTKVIAETASGSATWNDFGFATIARSLPFGGVGDSGWGSYHGYDGFRTFSHFKSILEIPYIFEPLMAFRYPPITTIGKTVLKLLLSPTISFSRPVSVEDERTQRVKRKVRNWLVIAIVFAAVGWFGRTRSL